MIEIVRKQIADLSSAERQNILLLTRAYYVDSVPLVTRALAHNNQIYLVRLEGKLVSFFMLGWELLTIQGEEKQALFLGLSCSDRQYRANKFTSIAYIQSVIDLLAWQEQNQQEVIIWGTTATPIIVKIKAKFWDIIQPHLTGDYDLSYIPIAEAIRQTHYPHRLPSDHPFVLKGVATGTRYCNEEQTYLDDVSREINLTIFKTLDIDESQGDRLLILMKTPGAEKVDRLKQELAKILGVPMVA